MASGNAFAIRIKKINRTIPKPATAPKYFSGYPPKKAKTISIENIINAVDKLAGRINIKTEKIGIQSGIIEDLKDTPVSWILVR
jgi:hypothetical protein